MSTTASNVKVSSLISGFSIKTPGLQFTLPDTLNATHTYNDGTSGNLKGQKFIYRASRALNNTNEDINFTTDLDSYGVAAAMTGLAWIWIRYTSGTAASYLTLKQPASNGVPNIFLAAGDGIKIAVGEERLIPFVIARTVTPSTGDLLNVVSTVADAVYDFVAFGY